jgi:hypothetical protein
MTLESYPGVDLADPDSLWEVCKPATGRKPYSRKATQYTSKKGSGKRGGSRCKCGICATCADREKWERVFNEKFLDSTYYGVRPIRHGSSLGDF